MKKETNYSNINNLIGLLKLFYIGTAILLFIGVIITIATPFLPGTVISFEEGIREWAYSVNLPIGPGALFIQGSIPYSILQKIPLEMININRVIIIDFFISWIILISLVNRGLKKLIDITTHISNGESPFQLKYVKELKKYSLTRIIHGMLLIWPRDLIL